MLLAECSVGSTFFGPAYQSSYGTLILYAISLIKVATLLKSEMRLHEISLVQNTQTNQKSVKFALVSHRAFVPTW